MKRIQCFEICGHLVPVSEIRGVKNLPNHWTGYSLYNTGQKHLHRIWEELLDESTAAQEERNRFLEQSSKTSIFYLGTLLTRSFRDTIRSLDAHNSNVKVAREKIDNFYNEVNEAIKTLK